MARIVERGRLIAGIDQTAYLFGSRNAITGDPEGFDIDIVRDLAFALFGDRDRVELRRVDIADRVRVVESGLVDLVVSTLTITCRRLQDVEFSTVYLEAGQRVLVNRDAPVDNLDDLSEKRVCAARGSTSLNAIATAPSRPIPVGVANETDCLVLLQLGEIDAISTDDTLLAGFAVQDPRTVLVGPRFTEEPYGVAVNRASPDLVRFVNAVLERRAADGTWQESYQRWLGSALGPPPAPPAARYRD
ncbi:MAG: glutamate ABC transporter substrate-binding protein [Pseudonocardia sp.]